MSRRRSIMWCIVGGVACTLGMAVYGQLETPAPPIHGWPRFSFQQDHGLTIPHTEILQHRRYVGRVSDVVDLVTASERPIGSLQIIPDRARVELLHRLDNWIGSHKHSLVFPARCDELDRFYQGEFVVVTLKLVGWPFRCLEGQSVTRCVGNPYMSGAPMAAAEPHDAVVLSSGSRDDPPRMIVYSPRWFGLVANTSIFASSFAAVFVVPGAIVRKWRSRGGGCAGCGYDLAGLPAGAPCPECGQALSVKERGA